MPSTTEQVIGLPDEELEELLGLIGGADSVELKLTLPEADQRSTIQALGLDPLDAHIRQVFFFDTPDLALNDNGVVVRARRIQGKKEHDSVVKLRPVVPDELPSQLRESPNLVVEVDTAPGAHVCSASMKGTVGPEDVAEAVSGWRPRCGCTRTGSASSSCQPGALLRKRSRSPRRQGRTWHSAT